MILNGIKIIDNQPVLGGYAGPDAEFVEAESGPIRLGGNISNIDYRNMILTPIIQ